MRLQMNNRPRIAVATAPAPPDPTVSQIFHDISDGKVKERFPDGSVIVRDDLRVVGGRIYSHVRIKTRKTRKRW